MPQTRSPIGDGGAFECLRYKEGTRTRIGPRTRSEAPRSAKAGTPDEAADTARSASHPGLSGAVSRVCHGSFRFDSRSDVSYFVVREPIVVVGEGDAELGQRPLHRLKKVRVVGYKVTSPRGEGSLELPWGAKRGTEPSQVLVIEAPRSKRFTLPGPRLCPILRLVGPLLVVAEVLDYGRDGTNCVIDGDGQQSPSDSCLAAPALPLDEKGESRRQQSADHNGHHLASPGGDHGLHAAYV